MTAESREELISAYLDGELPDDERAQVEKWLAESSQLRQLHDELRALRSGMQSLERHKLDHDLSRSVLRRAEQAVLRGSEVKAAARTAGPASRAASWWNRGAGWRRVVWPAVAVAAALAILIYDAGQRGAEREVAQAPEEQKSAAQLDNARPADEPAAAAFRESPALSEEDNLGVSEFQSGAAAGQSLERMPQKSGEPGKSLSEPAGGLRGLGRMRSESLSLKVDGAGGIVLEVSPEFLNNKSFEKLLDKKKIEWQRLAQNESRDDAADADGELAKKEIAKDRTFLDARNLARATYIVDAPPAQVEEILAELAGNARLLSGGKDERRSDSAAPRQKLAAGAGRRVTITLVAPAEPAAPAAAAPADKP